MPCRFFAHPEKTSWSIYYHHLVGDEVVKWVGGWLLLVAKLSLRAFLLGLVWSSFVKTAASFLRQNNICHLLISWRMMSDRVRGRGWRCSTVSSSSHLHLHLHLHLPSRVKV